MSPTITLPYWTLFACAILWIITIALLFILRLAKKGTLVQGDFDQSLPSYPQAEQGGFNARVQHELLSQQIDTVFNAMAAVIETERVKLKALIATQPSNSSSTVAFEPETKPAFQKDAPSTHFQAESETSPQPQAFRKDSEIGSTVCRLSDQGFSLGEIARRLGLSLNEVSLASKMGSAREVKKQPSRLHAVA